MAMNSVEKLISANIRLDPATRRLIYPLPILPQGPQAAKHTTKSDPSLVQSLRDPNCPAFFQQNFRFGTSVEGVRLLWVEQKTINPRDARLPGRWRIAACSSEMSFNRIYTAIMKEDGQKAGHAYALERYRNRDIPWHAPSYGHYHGFCYWESVGSSTATTKENPIPRTQRIYTDYSTISEESPLQDFVYFFKAWCRVVEVPEQFLGKEEEYALATMPANVRITLSHLEKMARYKSPSEWEGVPLIYMQERRSYQR